MTASKNEVSMSEVPTELVKGLRAEVERLTRDSSYWMSCSAKACAREDGLRAKLRIAHNAIRELTDQQDHCRCADCAGAADEPKAAPVADVECPHGYRWRACRECQREDAWRYQFLRQPGNAIVYAKNRNAWGEGASGHVRYDTPEQLDAAIDAARAASKTSEGT